MSIKLLADHIASHGRGRDTTLVHMSPREVHGLQAIAKAHGGSLTINPKTGLPEAGFLDNLLGGLGGAAAPLLGAGLSYFTDGAVSPLMTGLGVGALSAATGSTGSQALMNGLGAYGGAGLTSAYMGTGADAAAGAANAAATGSPTAAAPSAVSNAVPGGDLGPGAADVANQTADSQAASINSGASQAKAAAAGSPIDFLKNNKWMAMAAAAPVVSNMLGGNDAPLQPASATNPGYIRPYTAYHDKQGNLQYTAGTPVQANGFGANPIAMAEGGAVRFDSGGAIPPSAIPTYAALLPSPAVQASNRSPVGSTPAPSGSDSQAVYNYLMGTGPNPYDPQYLQGANNGSTPAAAASSSTSGAGAGTGTGGTADNGAGLAALATGMGSGHGQGPVNGNMTQAMGTGTTSPGFKNAYDQALAWTGNAGSAIGNFSPLTGGLMQGVSDLGAQANNGYGPMSLGNGYSDPRDAQALGLDAASQAAQLAASQETAAQAAASPDATFSGNQNGGSFGGAGGGGGGERGAHGGLANNGHIYASGGALNARGDFFSPSGVYRFHGAKVYTTPTSQTAPAPETGTYAHGGIAALHQGMQPESHLGSYSDGGRLLKGPGDGVSDDIPATIGHNTPARLANNEFVIPARIVSEIGNGSTDAGAKALYQMMDRIQAGRKKTIGKDKIAVDTKAVRHLPA